MSTFLCLRPARLFSLALYLVLFSSASASTAKGMEAGMVVLDGARPDFFVQSIFSEKAQKQVITQLRKTSLSAVGVDPLSHRFEAPIVVDLDLEPRMRDSMRELIERLLHIRFGEGKVEVKIEGLKLESPSAGVILNDVRTHGGGLSLRLGLSLKRTRASADRILIRFKPKSDLATSEAPPSPLDYFFIELKGPSLHAEALNSLSARVRIRTDVQADGSTRVSMDGDVRNIFARLDADRLAEEIVFDPGEIHVPDGFGIQVGSVQMPLRLDGLRKSVWEKRAEIARMMFEPLAAELRKLPDQLFAREKGVPSFVIPPVLELDLPCFGRVGLRLMRYGRLGSEQIQVAFGLVMPGYPSSNHGFRYFNQASVAAHESIDRNDASIILGAGYRAMSWILRTALEGCLKEQLPKELALGPKGVVVRMDEPGNGAGVIALHATTRPKFLTRLLIGAKTLEFPIKLTPKLAFINALNADLDVDLPVSALRLDLGEADLSDEVLLRGYRRVPSNLDSIRLGKLVRKRVRQQISSGLDGVKIDLPLPFAKGDDLRFAKLRADGFGNLVLDLRLDPDIDPEAKDFWSIFTDQVKPLLMKRVE